MSSVEPFKHLKTLKNIFNEDYSDEVLAKIALVFASPSANLLYTVDIAAAVAENAAKKEGKTLKEIFPPGMDKSIALFVKGGKSTKDGERKFKLVDRKTLIRNIGTKFGYSKKTFEEFGKKLTDGTSLLSVECHDWKRHTNYLNVFWCCLRYFSVPCKNKFGFYLIDELNRTIDYVREQFCKILESRKDYQKRPNRKIGVSRLIGKFETFRKEMDVFLGYHRRQLQTSNTTNTTTTTLVIGLEAKTKFKPPKNNGIDINNFNITKEKDVKDAWTKFRDKHSLLQRSDHLRLLCLHNVIGKDKELASWCYQKDYKGIDENPYIICTDNHRNFIGDWNANNWVANLHTALPTQTINKVFFDAGLNKDWNWDDIVDNVLIKLATTRFICKGASIWLPSAPEVLNSLLKKESDILKQYNVVLLDEKHAKENELNKAEELAERISIKAGFDNNYMSYKKLRSGWDLAFDKLHDCPQKLKLSLKEMIQEKHLDRLRWCLLTPLDDGHNGEGTFTIEIDKDKDDDKDKDADNSDDGKNDDDKDKNDSDKDDEDSDDGKPDDGKNKGNNDESKPTPSTKRSSDDGKNKDNNEKSKSTLSTIRSDKKLLLKATKCTEQVVENINCDGISKKALEGVFEGCVVQPCSILLLNFDGAINQEIAVAREIVETALNNEYRTKNLITCENFLNALCKAAEYGLKRKKKKMDVATTALECIEGLMRVGEGVRLKTPIEEWKDYSRIEKYEMGQDSTNNLVVDHYIYKGKGMLLSIARKYFTNELESGGAERRESMFAVVELCARTVLARHVKNNFEYFLKSNADENTMIKVAAVVQEITDVYILANKGKATMMLQAYNLLSAETYDKAKEEWNTRRSTVLFNFETLLNTMKDILERELGTIS